MDTHPVKETTVEIDAFCSIDGFGFCMRAGATLQVIGAFNRWLKISHNGGEAWMADWVSHRRVDVGAPAPSTAPSQSSAPIDNCCFVDRQCHSAQDWTDGYWAFQNGQCAAPAQPLTTSSDTGHGDNCCHFGWQCSTDDDWLIGSAAFQKTRCKSQGIVFEGLPRVIARVQAALEFLRIRAPLWYDYAVTGYERIIGAQEGQIISHSGDQLLALFYPESIYLEWPLIHSVSTVIHYACHGHQERVGLAGPEIEVNLRIERQCLRKEIEAMEVYAPDNPSLDFMRHRLANIDDIEFQWWVHQRIH